MNTFKSDISGQEFPLSDRVSGHSIRASLLAFIQLKHPDFNINKQLSISELNHFRENYIADFLVREMGELNKLERTVLGTLQDQSILTDKLEDEVPSSTLGQRIADRVAAVGGSWRFIIGFGLFLMIWILVNVLVFSNRGFDPYPFILLNLLLSCLAAIQAPIIMMSQNRQEEKDRERAKKDYMINLKSELEIRILHEKIDHLIMHQQQQLLEIQKVQVDMLNDLLERNNRTL